MPHSLNNPEILSVSYERLEYLSVGKAGIVYGIDEGRVLKEYLDNDDSIVERRAYERLGSHPHIAKYLGCLENGSLILERGQVLRQRCQQPDFDEIPFQRKLCWLIQAAKGYQRVHEVNIIHADVGCQNMILTQDDCIKLIDFEGCSIDGGSASSCYEWFSYRNSTPRVSRQTDIFAFGCAIYEIVTGKAPYHEYEKSNDPYRSVEELYETGQFPDVTQLPLGEVIRACWTGGFDSMSEVIRDLEAFRAFIPGKPQGRADCPTPICSRRIPGLHRLFCPYLVPARSQEAPGGLG